MARLEQERAFLLNSKALDAQVAINDHEYRDRARGQIVGATISISALVCSGFCAYLGQATTAALIGTTTVISIATIFVLRQRPEKILSREV